MFFLFTASQAAESLKGNVAECGSRKGKSSLYILAGLGAASTKCFHVFDSFEGLSQPMAEDFRSDGKTSWAKGDLAHPEDSLLETLSRYRSRIRIHKGWIPDKFKEVRNERFCLVHFDVDLYQPTRDSLEFFYDRVLSRGMIVCDDYGFRSCPGEKRAFDEFFAAKAESVLQLPSGQALVVKT